MRAIVGLGNPGREYAGTRHNIGFDVVDEVARRWNVHLRPWKSVATLAVVTSRAAVLAEPQTFMNLSGDAVGRIAAFHKLEPNDVLVVVDEVQLPLGRLRARRSGSAGGHNGLKSIIQHIGAEFPRLRIGVGRGDPTWDLADHVLSRFARDERSAVTDAVNRAADAVELFVEEGIEAVMNRFNAEIGKSEKSEE
jgi:peptidyl-tRNA hydrolase, PTH1 family